MLPALAPRESAPAKLADLADSALRATPEQLAATSSPAPTVTCTWRRWAMEWSIWSN